MKKFILLLAMTIVSLTAVEAQSLTKIYGKNSMGTQYQWINFETDTLEYFPSGSSTPRLNTLVYFAVVYKNGSTPLDQGDTIFFDFKVGVASIFDGDSLRYILKSPLAAEDTLWIDMNELPEQMNNSLFINSFANIDAFRDRTTLTATMFKTNKFEIPASAKTKQVTAYFLRTTGSSLTEKAIQNVQLFPNPVSSSLNITNLNNTKIEIYNVVGQQILTYNNVNGNLNVDMTSYPNGIYFVKMQNGKSVRTEKIKLVK